MWEYNACAREYADMQADKAEECLLTCWQTANFVGAAVWGKLRKPSHYKRDRSKSQAPRVSKEQFEQALAKARRGGE